KERVFAGGGKLGGNVEFPARHRDVVTNGLGRELDGDQKCNDGREIESVGHALNLKGLGVDPRPQSPTCYQPASYEETFALASATIARNSLLGLKTGTGRAATSTGSPVRGLRAIRVFRRRILKVPNPRISMLCCSASAAFTASRNASTTLAQSFFEIIGPAVRAIVAVTFSTRSAFVMHPPDRPALIDRKRPSGPKRIGRS